jgi:hypothetical protein
VQFHGLTFQGRLHLSNDALYKVVQVERQPFNT